jgi:hypothetical protein
VDHPLPPPVDAIVRPWRTAAFVAAAIATVELLLLVVVGGALLAKPDAPGRAHAAKPKGGAASEAPSNAKPAKPKAQTPAAPALARTRVEVLVLNGNGVQGAAAAAAAKVERRGYRIGEVTNAPRMDYVRSVVMYRTGFAAEAQRLARDIGVGIVGPLDGIRPGRLHGAHAVVVVGS